MSILLKRVLFGAWIDIVNSKKRNLIIFFYGTQYGVIFLIFIQCVSLSRYESVKTELEKQKENNVELRISIAERDGRLGSAYAEKGNLLKSYRITEKEAQEQGELIKKLKDSVNASKFKLRLSGRRLVLILPSDILFASGSDVISKAGNRAVEEITRILMTGSNTKYQVEGHTDNIPIHTHHFPSNWELAAARSLNILHTMVAAGMPPELLSSASFADTRPVESNDNEEGREANRRIEIAVIPDLSALSVMKSVEQTSKKK